MPRASLGRDHVEPGANCAGKDFYGTVSGMGTPLTSASRAQYPDAP